ncbi:MAG: O-antigen ligase family protein, partial [Bacteroidota bacterium]
MIEDLMDMKEQYIPLAYGYIFLSMMLAGYLTYRSAAQNKIVVGAISFFLLTGNFNEVITFGLPPDRVLGLICAGYLGWRLVFGGFRNSRHPIWVVPYFQIVLALYIFYIFLSQIVNATTLVTPSSKAMIDIYYAVNFIFLLYGVWATVDQEGLKVIGKCIVIGAAVSGLLSIYQLGIDPLFMRIGDHRIAFGKTLRSNGLFMNEYYNAYFIIIALGWTMVTIHKKWLRFALMGIFVVAVITTFQRMSWLILTMVMSVYIIKVEKVAYEKLAFSGLLAMIGIVFIVLFFQREISNSNFVKERLSEPIDSRYGYYAMVTDNIWKHPVFGYGGVYNELY